MDNLNIRFEQNLKLLFGTISDYKCIRKNANFVFSRDDKAAIGVVAVAASVAGASGLAASTASSTNAEEEADYLEFTLDGHPVKGWVWRSPFNNGDEVQVVAQPFDSHHEAFAIARPTDRIVALYPHCSRGRIRHWLIVARWWVLASTFSILLATLGLLLSGAISSSAWIEVRDDIMVMVPRGAFIVYPFFLLVSVSLGWKWLSFVRLAERIFQEFGWHGAGSIDLKRISRATRTATDTSEYGIFYFRY